MGHLPKINSLNILPPLPTLSWKKNTSPSPENLKIKKMGINKGENITNANPEKIISKKRSIITSFDLNIYQSLYVQNRVKGQNII